MEREEGEVKEGGHDCQHGYLPAQSVMMVVQSYDDKEWEEIDPGGEVGKQLSVSQRLAW